MIATEGCYYEHCMTEFRNKFRKFLTTNNLMLKMFRKVLKLFVEDSLQLSALRKFYCHCLESVKVVVVAVNTTILKENLLKLNPNLEST